MSDAVSLDQLRQACRKSLYFLSTQIMKHTDWDTIHDELEIFLAKPASKKALLLPRGHLKTSIVTVDKSIQYILNNPNIRILIANQVWDKARDMLSEIKENLEDKSQLSKIFGTFRSPVWNQDGFIVNGRTKALKEPTIATTGVEAETTGGHYDVIFLDDLMGLQNCQTPEQREKVKRFRRSMINLLEPGGTLIEVGTRWHLDDTFSEIFEKEREYYDIMVRTVVENGKIIFPKKFNLKFDRVAKRWSQTDEPCMDYIEHLKRSMTPAEFSSQYMNNPIDEENQIFRQEYFKTYAKRAERQYVAMTIDPAISEKQSADYFVINVSGMDERHNIQVLDSVKGHWRVSEQIDNIFTTYLKWRPSVVGLETVAYQKALKHFLEEEMRRRNVYFPITELNRSTNQSKEFRIKALEPYYRAGMIEHAPWMKSLEEELLTFPRGRHDDEIDALASQLEVLLPGEEAAMPAVPPDSWQAAFESAHAHRHPYRSFFEERVA